MALKHKTHDTQRPAVVQRTPTQAVRTENKHELPSHPAVALKRTVAWAPAALRPADIFALQRSVGNRAVQRILAGRSQALQRGRVTIQAKLAVGPAGDHYEREADRVAQQVMTMDAQSAGPSIQRTSENAEEDLQRKPSPISITPLVQRQTSPDDEEIQTSLLQDQTSAEAVPAGPDIETAIQSARGSGQSLPEAFSDRMERAFAADFSGVRVHTNAAADSLNHSLQARAFTTGENLFFKQGEYNPHSREGQQLIAHELTHVVQQSGHRDQGANSIQANTIQGTAIQRAPTKAELRKAKKAEQKKADEEKKKKDEERKAKEAARQKEEDELLAKHAPDEAEALKDDKVGRMKKLLEIKAQLRKEEAKKQEEKEALERQAKEEAARIYAAAVKKRKGELVTPIKKIAAAATVVKQKQIAGINAVEEVKRDFKIRTKPGVKNPMDAIKAARAIVDTEEDWATNRITPETQANEADASSVKAANAETTATTAHTNLTNWIDSKNLTNQTTYQTAAEAINLGYVKDAELELQDTYVSESDTDGGFGAEYQETTAGNVWVFHVHRTSGGKLKVAHTKPDAGSELRQAIAKSAFSDLPTLGVNDPDTTRTDG
jgi:hypothetical protein